MQIDSRRRHRHFLAVPLFLGALVLSAAGVSASATLASAVGAPGTVSAEAGDAPFSFPDLPAAGILSEGARIRAGQGRLWLEAGVALVSTPSAVTLRVDDLEFTIFKGAFLAVKKSDGVTVMALTSPVLLRHGGYRLLVPTAFEGTWSPSDLPEAPDLADVAERFGTLEQTLPEIRKQQLERLALVPAVDLPPFPAAADSLVPDFLTLPRADERSEEQRRIAAFSALRGALEAGDPAGARSALEHPLVLESLQAGPDPATLETLVALSEKLPSVGKDLLQYLHDPDLWILLSLHPRYALAAWETGGPVAMPLFARAQRILQFPATDLSEAYPSAAVRRWSHELSIHLAAEDDPAGFSALLLRSLKTFRLYAAERDLPERMLRVASVVREAIAPHRDALPEDARAEFDAWIAEGELPEYRDAAPLPVAEEIETIPEAAVAEAPAPAPEPLTAAEAAALEAEAKKLLHDAGALFAVTTALRAVERGQVDVEGLIVASDVAEHRYDFRLDLAGSRVTAVRKDGQVLPYPMAFDAFVAWAKGR